MGTTAATAMANRVALRTGFDPTIIIAIITAIMQVISNCKKPTPAEAGTLLADAHANHPDVCPIWLRGCFRKNGVKGFAQINDLWANMVDDANDHQEEACAMLAAA